MELIPPDTHILAIGAHPDDVEFGCFGSLGLATKRTVMVISRGEQGGDPCIRVAEAEASAAYLGADLRVSNLPDTYLEVPAIVALIEEAVAETKPDIVLSMAEEDLHQDHQAVARATQIALRGFSGPLLAYGTPSSVDRFVPNTIIGLASAEMNRKMEAISLHKSQSARRYMQPGYIESIARYWAAMARTRCDFAEPFRLVKWFSSAEDRTNAPLAAKS